MTNIEKSKFSQISNIIFLSITTFAVSFVWINYYLKNLKYSLISSIIIAFSFLIVYLVFIYYRNKLYIRSNNTKNQILNLKNHLLYSNTNLTKDTLSRIYSFGNIIPTKEFNHYINILNKKDIYFLFNKEIINEEDFVYIYQTCIYKNIDVFCIDHIPKLTVLENTNINIQNLNQINKEILDKNIQLEYTTQIKKKSKLKPKDVFCIILNKSKSKNYLFWGLILIFFSIFSPYYIYYNIVGSLILLLSVYSRFNKRFN